MLFSLDGETFKDVWQYQMLQSVCVDQNCWLYIKICATIFKTIKHFIVKVSLDSLLEKSFCKYTIR